MPDPLGDGSCANKTFESGDTDSRVGGRDTKYIGKPLPEAMPGIINNIVRPDITETQRQINAKAPNAKIVLMGYPRSSPTRPTASSSSPVSASACPRRQPSGSTASLAGWPKPWKAQQQRGQTFPKQLLPVLEDIAAPWRVEVSHRTTGTIPKQDASSLPPHIDLPLASELLRQLPNRS